MFISCKFPRFQYHIPNSPSAPPNQDLGHSWEIQIKGIIRSYYSALPMKSAYHSSCIPTPKGSICGANRGTCGCASLRAHIEHVILQCRCEPASICSLKTSNHSQNLPSPIRGRQENGYPRKLHYYKCLVHLLSYMVNGYKKSSNVKIWCESFKSV